MTSVLKKFSKKGKSKEGRESFTSQGEEPILDSDVYGRQRLSQGSATGGFGPGAGAFNTSEAARSRRMEARGSNNWYRDSDDDDSEGHGDGSHHYGVDDDPFVAISAQTSNKGKKRDSTAWPSDDQFAAVEGRLMMESSAAVDIGGDDTGLIGSEPTNWHKSGMKKKSKNKYKATAPTQGGNDPLASAPFQDVEHSRPDVDHEGRRVGYDWKSKMDSDKRMAWELHEQDWRERARRHELNDRVTAQDENVAKQVQQQEQQSQHLHEQDEARRIREDEELARQLEELEVRDEEERKRRQQQEDERLAMQLQETYNQRAQEQAPQAYAQPPPQTYHPPAGYGTSPGQAVIHPYSTSPHSYGSTPPPPAPPGMVQAQVPNGYPLSHASQPSPDQLAPQYVPGGPPQRLSNGSSAHQRSSGAPSAAEIDEMTAALVVAESSMDPYDRDEDLQAAILLQREELDEARRRHAEAQALADAQAAQFAYTRRSAEPQAQPAPVSTRSSLPNIFGSSNGAQPEVTRDVPANSPMTRYTSHVSSGAGADADDPQADDPSILYVMPEPKGASKVVVRNRNFKECFVIKLEHWKVNRSFSVCDGQENVLVTVRKMVQNPGVSFFEFNFGYGLKGRIFKTVRRADFIDFQFTQGSQDVIRVVGDLKSLLCTFTIQPTDNFLAHGLGRQRLDDGELLKRGIPVYYIDIGVNVNAALIIGLATLFRLSDMCSR
eukprot:Clim_evm87s236 gene=Clim_evmTU87s236